jgi:L-ribulose-5-phosphate 3-epimerase
MLNRRNINRRDAISALGAVALSARGAFAQQPPAAPPASPATPQRVTPEVAEAHLKPGARPLLCVYSGCFAKIPYAQLPEIVSSMGYDGIDLTVMPGGHVDPSRYMVDLDRAFQTFQDAGIELPMVTTSFTSPSQAYAYAILYVSAELGARFCRLGTWPAPAVPDVAAQNGPSQLAAIRAMMVRNDLAQFAATGTRCNITPLLANHAGSYPGRSIPEAEALLAGIEPKAFGYCFDPVQAVMEALPSGGMLSGKAWESALQAALPRLGAVALSDVALDQEPGAALKPRQCALGEGVIDWKKFFSILAAARFHGPVSIHMDYASASAVNAMKKDLAFARARVEEAWPVS